jgi:hypothetical protein
MVANKRFQRKKKLTAHKRKKTRNNAGFNDIINKLLYGRN